jgi:hypothetical protein
MILYIYYPIFSYVNGEFNSSWNVEYLTYDIYLDYNNKNKWLLWCARHMDIDFRNDWNANLTDTKS